MAVWDDSTKFWHETLRTMTLAVIGALATVWIVKRWEQSLAYEGELAKTRLSIRAKVVDDFSSASYRYTAVASDACKAYSKDFASRSPEETATIGKFENEVVDGYRTAMERIEIYFDGEQGLTKNLGDASTLHKELFGQCKEKGVDQRVWEAKRQALKEANRTLAIAALKFLRFNGESNKSGYQ